MKKVLLVLWGIVTGLGATAAEPDTLTTDTISNKNELGLIRRTVREFDRTDDEYIEPNHYEFTVMGQITRTYESFILSSNDQRITLSPDSRTKIGPYFGWRWFFLGYTFDIKNIGFNQGGIRKEFDLSIYSSQIGLDFYYRRTGNDYKIRDVKLGPDIDGRIFEGMPFAGVNVGITGASLYYIFNHRHFSYPAAFSQSTCQKISCGSWLGGIGFMHNTLDMNYDQLQQSLGERLGRGYEVELDSGMMFSDIKYDDFMLSGGYAYNWVFAKNWLFCASAQAALCYKSSYGKVADEKKGFSFDKINLDGLVRLGLVYNNTRWYAGCSAIFRTNNYHTANFTANNIFGSINAYIGYNFMLKKKYRKSKA